MSRGFPRWIRRNPDDVAADRDAVAIAKAFGLLPERDSDVCVKAGAPGSPTRDLGGSANGGTGLGRETPRDARQGSAVAPSHGRTSLATLGRLVASYDARGRVHVPTRERGSHGL